MLNAANILSHRVQFAVLTALQEVGVIDLLREGQPISIEELAERVPLNAHVLRALLDFLVLHHPEFLQSDGDVYVGSGDLQSDFVKNILYFGLAYEPVFQQLSQLLDGSVHYGAGVCRKGKYLNVSSQIYNRSTWDLLFNLISSTPSIEVVVDLGCSEGDFLKELSGQSHNIQGVGVDVDREVVTAASRSVKDGRVRFVQGNAGCPEDLVPYIARKKESFQHIAFVGITMWHEFLGRNKDSVIDIFTKYRTLFPGARFIVAEYEGMTDAQLKLQVPSVKNAGSVYQLVHLLTGQGVPPVRDAWIELYSKSGIALESVYDVPPQSVVLVGRL